MVCHGACSIKGQLLYYRAFENHVDGAVNEENKIKLVFCVLIRPLALPESV